MDKKPQKEWSELDLIKLLGEKSSPSPLEGVSKEPTSKQGLPLLVKIIIGSICGWAGCFVLIVFIIGGGFEDIFDMDEFAARLILFISFPMGIIIGGGIAIALHKKEKKSGNEQKVLSEKQSEHQKIEEVMSASNIEQLIQLKQLMDSGVISAEEFDQMKAKIINS